MQRMLSKRLQRDIRRRAAMELNQTLRSAAANPAKSLMLWTGREMSLSAPGMLIICSASCDVSQFQQILNIGRGAVAMLELLVFREGIAD